MQLPHEYHYGLHYLVATSLIMRRKRRGNEEWLHAAVLSLFHFRATWSHKGEQNHFCWFIINGSLRTLHLQYVSWAVVCWPLRDTKLPKLCSPYLVGFCLWGWHFSFSFSFLFHFILFFWTLMVCESNFLLGLLWSKMYGHWTRVMASVFILL